MMKNRRYLMFPLLLIGFITCFHFIKANGDVGIEDVEAFLDPQNSLFSELNINQQGTQPNQNTEQGMAAPLLTPDHLQRIENEKLDIQERIRLIELEVQEKAKAEHKIKQELQDLLDEEKRQAELLNNVRVKDSQVEDSDDLILKQKQQLTEKTIELERLRAKEEEMRIAREQEENRIRIQQTRIQEQEALLQAEQNRLKEQQLEELRKKNEEMIRRKAQLEQKQREIKENQDALKKKESDLITQQIEHDRLIQLAEKEHLEQMQREADRILKEQQEEKQRELQKIERQRQLEIEYAQEIERLEAERSIQLQAAEQAQREFDQAEQDRILKEQKENQRIEQLRIQEEQRIQKAKAEEQHRQKLINQQNEELKQQQIQLQQEQEEIRKQLQQQEEQDLLKQNSNQPTSSQNIQDLDKDLSNEQQQYQQENDNQNNQEQDSEELDEQQLESEENDSNQQQEGDVIPDKKEQNKQQQQQTPTTSTKQSLNEEINVETIKQPTDLIGQYYAIVESFVEFLESTCSRVIYPGFIFIRNTSPFNYIVFTYILIRLTKFISKRLFRGKGSKGQLKKFQLSQEAQMDFADLQNQLESLSTEVNALSKVVSQLQKNPATSQIIPGQNTSSNTTQNTNLLSQKLQKKLSENDSSIKSLETQFNSLIEFQTKFSKSIIEAQTNIMQEVYETRNFIKQTQRKRPPSSGGSRQQTAEIGQSESFSAVNGTTSAIAMSTISAAGAGKTNQSHISSSTEIILTKNDESDIIHSNQVQETQEEEQQSQQQFTNPPDSSRVRKGSMKHIEDQFMSTDGNSFFDNPLTQTNTEKQPQKQNIELTIQRQRTLEDSEMKSENQPIQAHESTTPTGHTSIPNSNTAPSTLTPRQTRAPTSPFESRPSQKSPFLSSKNAPNMNGGGNNFSLLNEIDQNENTQKQVEGVTVILPTAPATIQQQGPFGVPRPVVAKPTRRVPAGAGFAQQFQNKANNQ